MKSIICRIIVAFLFSLPLCAQDQPPASYDGPTEKLHIYLLIGQSNMAGRARHKGELNKVIPRCYLLNDKDAWEPAKNPLNRYSTIKKEKAKQGLNPGYSFSKTMLKKDEGISVGLVVNARGGSSIGSWAKGTEYYKEAVRRTKAAMKTGRLKGILWHQGESNAQSKTYLKELKLLVENLRADLGIPDLPFLAGQINSNKEYPVNKQIAKLPATVDSTGVVSSGQSQTIEPVARIGLI